MPRWFALAAIAGSANMARAQGEEKPVVDPTVVSTPALEPAENTSDGTPRRTGTAITPLFAPIPIKNSQTGWGLVVVAGAIHRFDPDTTLKPSTGMVAGFYTQNQSWGIMAVEVARLRHDTWRLRGVLSHFDVRYDFYGIGEDAGDAGRSVGLEQPMDFAIGAALYRLLPGFYAGPAAIWIRSKVMLQDDHGLSPPPSAQDMTTLNLLAPGAQAEYDTRNDDYWPRRGSLATFKGSFYATALGSARGFQRYAAAWSWFTNVRAPAFVLATNLNAAAAAGDAPFWAIPSVGMGRYGLRGYTQGRYRDHVVATAQAELRAHSSGRLAGTLFGGLAQVAPSVGELKDARALPAGGVGLRFQLTRQYPMHMRADYAWGRDESLFYFGVGEAF